MTSPNNHFAQNEILQGDCLEFMREMPDKSVDLILTDPPYGGILTKRNGNGLLKDAFTRYGGEQWDYKPEKEYFLEMKRVSKNQIIFGGNYFTDYLDPSACWIVWDKNRISAQSFSDCELAWTSFDGALKIVEITWDGFRMETDHVKEIRQHPTQKPVKLMEYCLEKFSKPGDVVLDPFMGSGSTVIACRRMERPYIGIEKEPVYFEIVKKRLEGVNNHRIDEWCFGRSAKGWI